MQKLDKYLKIGQAAEFLGIAQNTLRKWADEGRIAGRVNSANGYRLFRQKDLERFLKDAAKPALPATRRPRLAPLPASSCSCPPFAVRSLRPAR